MVTSCHTLWFSDVVASWLAVGYACEVVGLV